MSNGNISQAAGQRVRAGERGPAGVRARLPRPHARADVPRRPR